MQSNIQLLYKIPTLSLLSWFYKTIKMIIRSCITATIFKMYMSNSH